MSSRPAKRARSERDIDVVDPSKLPELVDSINSRTITNLLIAVAKAYPDIASLVQREVDRIAAAKRVKVVNFDYLSKSTWKTLNVTYNRIKNSHAFDMISEAIDSIKGCFETIRIRCLRTFSFKIKESALKTLRKIEKSIYLSNEIINREIKKHYQSEEKLISIMFDILKSLNYKEFERLRSWYDNKLIELQGLTDGYCIFENLDEIIKLWNEDEESKEEDNDDSDDNEEDEEKSEDGEEPEDERFVAEVLPQKHREIL